MPMPSIFRARALALVAFVAAGAASPAIAAPEPSTRVVSCKAGSCLLVTGHRADAAATVSINGHAVATEGARKWQVRVPVETVRQWSAPLARTITVSIDGAISEARLPIGLLGHSEDLAMLLISVK